jgi:hypothetical protein
MRRLDAVAVLLLAVGALALAGSAIARPADSPSGTQRLGEPPQATDYTTQLDPAIATGPDGRAIALVTRDGHAIVRRARPGRRFGAPRRLPLGSKANTLAAAAGAGFAALAWTHFDATYFPLPYSRDVPCCARLRAALIDRPGRVTHPRTLSAPGSNVESMLLSVRGRRAAIAWRDARGVRTSIATRGRGFSRPVTVTPSEGSLLGVALPRSTPHVFLVLGYRAPWTVVETWRHRGRTRRRTLGRFGGRVTTVEFQAVVAPSGRMLLAGDLFRRKPRLRRLDVATRRPGGRLRATRLRVPLTRSGTATAIALAPSGRGLVATADGARRLALRPVDRGGHVGPARYVTTRSPLAASAMAIDSSGAGVLTVHTVGGTSAHRHDRLLAWALSPGTRPGPRRTLPPGTTPWWSGLTVTVDRRVAWTEGRFTYAARLP